MGWSYFSGPSANNIVISYYLDPDITFNITMRDDFTNDVVMFINDVEAVRFTDSYVNNNYNNFNRTINSSHNK